VRGAVPGLAFQQARRGIQQERQHRTIGLGQVQRALQRRPGGGRVAERVAGDRLQQERVSQPHPGDAGSGAVQDRGERSSRRVYAFVNGLCEFVRQ
jgi:hypothetical protein